MKVYLAGPDVFLPNAKEFGDKKKAICQRYGLTGLFPLDNEIDGTGMSLQKFAFAISRANEELIDSSVGIIANMTPFRGPSTDVGTAFEIGYARAKKKLIFGCSNTTVSFLDRTRAFCKSVTKDGDNFRDQDHMALESFGLTDNLMLDGSIHACGGELICGEVPAGEMFTSLVVFEKCVAAFAKKALAVKGS